MVQNGFSGRSAAQRDVEHRASVATHPRSRFAPPKAGFFCAVTSLRKAYDASSITAHSALSTYFHRRVIHMIVFRGRRVGSVAPTMLEHRQAAPTPSGGREKRPCGRPCRPFGRRRAALVMRPASRRTTLLAEEPARPSDVPPSYESKYWATTQNNPGQTLPAGRIVLSGGSGAKSSRFGYPERASRQAKPRLRPCSTAGRGPPPTLDAFGPGLRQSPHGPERRRRSRVAPLPFPSSHRA